MSRCDQCGADVSAWAARCPECRAALTASAGRGDRGRGPSEPGLSAPLRPPPRERPPLPGTEVEAATQLHPDAHSAVLTSVEALPDAQPPPAPAAPDPVPTDEVQAGDEPRGASGEVSAGVVPGEAPAETTLQAPAETTLQAPAETTLQAPAETTLQAPAETVWGPARFAAPTQGEMRSHRQRPDGVVPGSDLQRVEAADAGAGAAGAGRAAGRGAGKPSDRPRRTAGSPAGWRGALGRRSEPASGRRPIPSPSELATKPPGQRSVPDPAQRTSKGRRGPSPVLVIVGGAAVLLGAALARHPSPKPTEVSAQATARPGVTVSPDAPSDLSGFTLVEVGANGAVSVAPFGGTARMIPGLTAASFPEEPVRTRTGVAVLDGGMAYKISPPPVGPVSLGPADHLFPSAVTGLVGVYRARGASGWPEVQFVPVAPDILGTPTFAIPSGYEPVAELSDGTLLLAAPQGGTLLLALWQAEGGAQGSIVTTIPNVAAVVGAGGTRFAWLSSTGCTRYGECPLHITDVVGHADVVVPPPPGYAGYLPAGAFSPMGANTLAIMVYDPITNGPGARLAFVSRPATGPGSWSPALVPDSVLVPGKAAPGHIEWTPDGARVLFAGGSGPLYDYRVGESAPYATEQPASATFTVFGEASPR